MVEARRLAVARLTWGAVEELVVTLVGMSSLRTPMPEVSSQLAMLLPLLSSSECHKLLCAFRSPMDQCTVR